jgi:hypothetical protein
MKNLFLLPTTQKSKIFFNHNKGFEKYQFSKEPFINGLTNTTNQNIYITNSEEIKEGDWKYCSESNTILQANLDKENKSLTSCCKYCKKIILTTDLDLIADGVQGIDDEFLEWFVNNPSCESVAVYNDKSVGYEYDHYSIIIPREESNCICNDNTCNYCEEQESIQILKEAKEQTTKQETLEEFALKYADGNGWNTLTIELVKAGAKWQAERMYSEEESIQKIIDYVDFQFNTIGELNSEIKKWFKQFKKK